MLAGARDSSGNGAQPPATSASPPILSRLLTGIAFERVFVVLSCLFAAGAYLDAWSYVSNPTGRSVLAPWQDLTVHGGWFLLTAWLGLAMLVNLTRGAPWREALPSAYLLALAACVAYGLALIVDQYVQLASPRPIGLSRLLSPLPFVEVISGGLIVAAPLRAAWERGESMARIETVVSASLLFSAITFFLQFAHPFRDPWAAGSGPPAQVVWWIAVDFGVTGLLLQSSLLTGLLLFMVRRFQMWPGSFTTICVINAVLVAGLKTRWEMVTVGLMTGIAADALYSVLRPSLARSSSARVFGAAIPVVFTTSFFATVWTFHGIWWDWNIWTGAILSSAVAGWLISYLVFLPATHAVTVGEPAVAWPAHTPEITAAAVKEALESMNQPGALGSSPLMDLRYLSGKSENRSAELRELLVDIVRELEASRTPRDAEAGRLLVDYYVRRTGTHEAVAERLHLSRPTFYRRLQRGLELVAERLDEMGEALTVVDAWAATPETKIESR
jgi:hypothetical protein